MKSFIIYLLNPFTIASIVTGVGVFALWRKRQVSKALLSVVTLGFVSMIVLELPVVSHFALGSLEWSFMPLGELPKEVQAIVVLSGSSNPPNSVQTEATLGSDTSHRCVYAASVYHRLKPMPVLVSGGKVDPTVSGPAVAQLMSDFLIKLGVDASAVELESVSRSTHENAVECRKVLDRRRIRRILLVTEAWHMRRAALCFRKQGIEIIPAACHHRATRLEGSILNFLPNPSSTEGLSDAFHEWLGLAWYGLRGWI